jgi:hypothetical protein
MMKIFEKAKAIAVARIADVPGEKTMRRIPLKKILTVTGAVLGVVVVLALVVRFVFDMYANHVAGECLGRQLPAEYQRLYDNALKPKADVPPEENSALMYGAAARLAGLYDLSEFQGLGINEYGSYEKTPKEMGKARVMLGRSNVKKALEIARLASDLPKASWGCSGWGTRAVRCFYSDSRLISLLWLKAMLELTDGSHEEAFSSALVALDMASKVWSEPGTCPMTYGTLAWILRVIEPAMSEHAISEEDCRRALELLAGIDPEAATQRAICVRRRDMVSIVERCMALSKGLRFREEEHFSGPLLLTIAREAVMPCIKYDSARRLEEFDRTWTGMRREDLVNANPDWWGMGIKGNFWEGGLASASRDTAYLAMALRLHKIRNGKYPASLAELVPGTIAGLPKDPFTGGEYRYKPSGDGFIVYSPGPGGRDDGGKKPETFLPPQSYDWNGPVDIVWECRK